MPILFDHDPETGITEYFDYDPITDQVLMTYSQDTSAMLDTIATARNNPDNWNKGVKESWAMYASIPPVVQMELMKKGLSLDRKDDMKAILKEINTNYPFLRLTDKWHR